MTLYISPFNTTRELQGPWCAARVHEQEFALKGVMPCFLPVKPKTSALQDSKCLRRAKTKSQNHRFSCTLLGASFTGKRAATWLGPSISGTEGFGRQLLRPVQNPSSCCAKRRAWLHLFGECLWCALLGGNSGVIVTPGTDLHGGRSQFDNRAGRQALVSKGAMTSRCSRCKHNKATKRNVLWPTICIWQSKTYCCTKRHLALI